MRHATLTSFQLKGAMPVSSPSSRRSNRSCPNVGPSTDPGHVEIRARGPAGDRARGRRTRNLRRRRGLAVLVIVAPMIARFLRLEAQETPHPSALGANRLAMRADQLIVVIGAVVLGEALAVLVAFGLSAFSPLDPVHGSLRTSV